MKKLTLFSFIYRGTRYSFFIMAEYDANGKAKIPTELFDKLRLQHVPVGHCMMIG